MFKIDIASSGTSSGIWVPSTWSACFACPSFVVISTFSVGAVPDTLFPHPTNMPAVTTAAVNVAGNVYESFGKHIIFSQEQLAEKVGISTTHMSHIETGNTKLSLQVFVNIADALSAQTDELLYDIPQISFRKI